MATKSASKSPAAYTNLDEATKACARKSKKTSRPASILRVGRGKNTKYIVASTPWAYRLQQQGRGVVVS